MTRTSSNDAYASNTARDVSRTYAVNGLNQYTGTTSGGTPSATFQYDPNGNLISDGSNNYVYDAENRLVSASGDHVATLSYDPLGRLWQVASPAATIRFLYDGDRLAIEYDGANNLLRAYVHGMGADEPLVWYEVVPSGVSRRYLHADHQGSIIAVTDQNGNAVAVNGYDEWGIPNAGNLGRFGYTGQAWLPELGLWYYKARIYSPTLGRFLQTDPVGYDDQLNLHSYVGNDPVNDEDPTGLADANTCSRVGSTDCSGSYATSSPIQMRPDTVPHAPNLDTKHSESDCAGHPHNDWCPAGPPNPEGYGRHHYDFFVGACSVGEAGCSEAAVFSTWRNNSAPGAPYAEPGVHDRMLTGGNPIRQFVDGRSRTILNATLPGHQFHYGTVRIQVVTQNQEIGARIIGFGEHGRNAIENQILGPILFRFLAIRVYYEMHPSDPVPIYVHH